jgi:hypothetical protein
MKHEIFTEWLYLSVFDELGDDENRRLEEHVRSCDNCRRERKKIVRMLDSITASGVGEPSDEMLANAQQSLRAALWKESLTQAATVRSARKEPLLARLFGFGRGGIKDTFRGAVRPGYRLALAGAATLSIGFFFGYVAFHSPQPTVPATQERPAGNGFYTGISNIQYLDVDAVDGEVDIIYDQVRPVHLRTTVSDHRVQDVLTYALLNDDNPGVRLKAIRAFDSDQWGAPPEEMKQAFLQVLTSDPNAGVRLQALLALRELPFDENVKNTVLFVLSHDENPGIRVAAINYLAEITIEGIMPEQEMYDILSGKFTADHESSVRSRPVNQSEEVE